MNTQKKFSFIFILFLAFVDYMGIGLIYPLFSSMLFDPTISLLPTSATSAQRGLWLGVTLAIMPIVQFFSSPFWGYLSDRKGRKLPLMISIGIGILAYGMAVFGVIVENLYILILSRFLLGIATGNMAVVQAVVADLSTPEKKTSNFGLYNMAMGLGFTLGPFLGGFFSNCPLFNCKGYSLPFWFAMLLTSINFVSIFFGFKETNQILIRRAFSATTGIKNLIKAFEDQGLKVLFITAFIFTFAWSFFFEFMPVFLIGAFSFTPEKIGIFYAVSGAAYALCCGVLIRPIVNRFKSRTVLIFGLVLAGVFIGSFIISLKLPPLLWVLLLPMCYAIALIFPTISATLSHYAPESQQGEVMGIYQSVSSAALGLSPLLSGYIVGLNKLMPIYIGSLGMIFAAIVLAFSLVKKVRHSL